MNGGPPIARPQSKWIPSGPQQDLSSPARPLPRPLASGNGGRACGIMPTGAPEEGGIESELMQAHLRHRRWLSFDICFRSARYTVLCERAGEEE